MPPRNQPAQLDEISMMLGELDMLPNLAPPYSANGVRRHAEGFRYRARQLQAKSFSDFYNVRSCQPRTRIALPMSGSVVKNLVGGVFFRRCPPDIGCAAVCAVPVVMRSLVSGRRPWPDERFRHKIVDAKALQLTVHLQRNGLVSSHNRLLESRASASAVNAPHSPHVRHLIEWRLRNYFPDFGGTTMASHSALPSRSGQGRALCNQRFRPVRYSRFASERKAA